MNIFFISPSINLSLCVNYGIAVLCGIIKQKGHTVDLYQPTILNLEEFKREFLKKDYSLCLVSSVTNQWPYTLKYLKALRKYSDIITLVGGPHATSCPEILEENEEINGICLGDGDIALSEFLDKFENKLSFYDVKSMWFRNSSRIIKNEMCDLIEDLDDTAFPDFSIFSSEAIENRISVMFSRGCPFNCTYCCNDRLRKLYSGKGKYVRRKSVQRAIEELEEIIRTHNPAELNFDDDTFIKDKNWIISFLNEYKKLTKIPFNCNSRPETLDEELCHYLREANCKTLCIGIESGNEEFRRNVYKRNISNESIKRAFSISHKYNLKSYAFNMVGAPDETYTLYQDTVNLNREILPKSHQITIYYPYPGTELYDYTKMKGYIMNNAYSDDFVSKSILRMKQFPRWKIKYAQKMFYYHVFKDQSTVKKIYYLAINYMPKRMSFIARFLSSLAEKWNTFNKGQSNRQHVTNAS